MKKKSLIIVALLCLCSPILVLASDAPLRCQDRRAAVLDFLDLSEDQELFASEARQVAFELCVQQDDILEFRNCMVTELHVVRESINESLNLSQRVKRRVARRKARRKKRQARRKSMIRRRDVRSTMRPPLLCGDALLALETSLGLTGKQKLQIIEIRQQAYDTCRVIPMVVDFRQCMYSDREASRDQVAEILTPLQKRVLARLAKNRHTTDEIS